MLSDLLNPLLDVLCYRLVIVRDANTLSNTLFTSSTEQELLDQCTNGSGSSGRLDDLGHFGGSRGNGRGGAGGNGRDGSEDLVRRSDRDVVLHEEVKSGVACAEEELCDLQSRKEALDALGNLDVDGRKSEVCVLFTG